MTKHMNFLRYNFFLNILFEHYNSLEIDERFSLIDSLLTNQIKSTKWKISEIDDATNIADFGDDF
jgi:hypothetical protein